MSGSHAIMRYTLIKTNDMKTKEHGLHYKSNTIACACRKLQTLLLCEIKKKETLQRVSTCEKAHWQP